MRIQIKQYNNLAETLEKYENKRGIRIAFTQLNQEFFDDFLNYMVIEHEYVTKVCENGVI